MAKKRRKKAKPPHVYLIAAARKIWRWSKKRKDAIELATRAKEWVECAKCKKWVRKNPLKKKQRREYAADHIEPVVPPGMQFPKLEPEPSTGSLGWDDFLVRLMYGDLQILCNPCHKEKTKKENDERKRKRQNLPALRRRKK